MKIVSAGIIICNHKILIAQRIRGKSLEYMWEFPGGKLEDGETLPQCLKREISEELGLDITVGKFFMTSEYRYEFGTIQLNAFFAESPTLQIDKLNAHEDYRWVSPRELKNYTFAPADIPIVEKLSSLKI